MPVFLLGTDNIMGGGGGNSGKICGKICGKMCGKIENCWIGTEIGVVVDMDPIIMILVTKRQKNKRKKRQKG